MKNWTLIACFNFKLLILFNVRIATLQAYARKKPINGNYEPLKDKQCTSFLMSPARDFHYHEDYDLSSYAPSVSMLIYIYRNDRFN